MELMLITNSPSYAKYAEDSGVDIIFIDLEIDGKLERQGHLDTVISSHSFSDIALVKNVLNKAKVLVRINPYNKNKTPVEIEKAIKYGADILMLPMFRTVEEIISVHKLIAGRCTFIPLLETVEAASLLDKILDENILTHLHIGLNDLHLGYQMKHMFQLFSDGIIDDLVAKLRSKGISFGIGGVAAMEGGDIHGEVVLKKYLAMGSCRVILSRTFHRSYSDILHLEISKLREITRSYKESYVESYSSAFDKKLQSLLS